MYRKLEELDCLKIKFGIKTEEFHIANKTYYKMIFVENTISREMSEFASTKLSSVGEVVKKKVRVMRNLPIDSKNCFKTEIIQNFLAFHLPTAVLPSFTHFTIPIMRLAINMSTLQAVGSETTGVVHRCDHICLLNVYELAYRYRQLSRLLPITRYSYEF